MNTEIDFEVLENEAIDGRIFLQFFSGDVTSQCKIDCLNRLCTLNGRMKMTKGNRQQIWHNYTFTLEMARAFAVDTLESESDVGSLPPGIKMHRATIVEATDFPYHVPAERIKIILICGTYEAQSVVQSKEISKRVCLLKVQVDFKPIELITRPATLAAYTIEEVVFDKLTLLRGRLNIPRPYTYSMDMFDIHINTTSTNANNATTTPPYKHRSPRNSTFGSPSPHSKRITTSRTLSSTDPYSWLSYMTNTNLAIELFVFFVTVLFWLLIRSYYLTPLNYHYFTLYSIMFVTLSALAIFSFRGSMLRTVLRQFAPPECNGRTMYVNGWNAWSFSGAVLQGHPPPVYSMPSMFVRAFHDGGVGTALSINLGYGEAPVFQSSTNTNSTTTNTNTTNTTSKDSVVRDFVADGMHSHSGESQLYMCADGVRRPTPIITSGDSQDSVHNTPSIHTLHDTPTTTHPHVDIVTSAAEYHTAAKDYIASDMFTIIADNRSKTGVVIGFLSQKQQFGCIATNRNYDRVSVHVSGDGSLVRSVSNRNGNSVDSYGIGTIETDWLCIYTVTTLIEPFKVYMCMSARENNVRLGSSNISTTPTTQYNSAPNTTLPPLYTTHSPLDSTHSKNTQNTHTIPSGWCSWYHFYDKISESVLHNNLHTMLHLRTLHHIDTTRHAFKLFQIDDGYQNSWGDWTTVNSKKFPTQSLAGIVSQIKAANLIPGLWMAPFACDKHSTLAKQHPEYILQSTNTTTTSNTTHTTHTNTNPANSANCGKFFYGLDTTHPGVQQHIVHCINTAKQWGIEYLKLDFLYSAVLSGAAGMHYNRTLTHAQIMQQAMQLVRDTAGSDMYVLGCGAPLGSCIGYVDANRVSADAGGSWNPDFPLPRSDKWNLPCARNCVRNTLTRLFMHHQWWINDPDCLMLRESLAFTLDEIRGIATTKALSGGSLILSDDLQSVSTDRMRILCQLMPPVQVPAVAIDLLERETPELFRTHLQSNFARMLLLQQQHIQNDTDEDYSYTSVNVTPEKPTRNNRSTHRDMYRDSYRENTLFRDSPLFNRDRGDSTCTEDEQYKPPQAQKGHVRFRSMDSLYNVDSTTSTANTANISNTTSTTTNTTHVRHSSDSLPLSLNALSSTNLTSIHTNINNFTANTTTNSIPNTTTNTNTLTLDTTIPDSPRQRLQSSLLHSPRGSRARHTQEKGLIFQVGADINLLRQQRRRVKEFLKEENVSNEDDLLGEYTLFTVCNWGESAKKDHFLSLRQIFGEEYIAQLVARGVLVNNMIRLQRASANNKLRREQRMGSGQSSGSVGGSIGGGSGSGSTNRREARTISPERLQRGISQLNDNTPRYIMHLFNFWTMHYSYRIVTLEENEDSEVAFLNIPRHSAHIYSVSLTTDPTLPKYVGSNLHFSCGSEVHRMYLTNVPLVAESYLSTILQGSEISPFDDLPSPQAYEPDFTFSDGFGPSGNENIFGDVHPNVHGVPKYLDTPVLTPVVRSMYISFEEGALRDSMWGGFIYVFLPVNGLNPRMTHASLGRIHVCGSAVEGLYTYANTNSSYNNNTSSTMYSGNSSNYNNRKGISSERVEEEHIRLEKHVRAPECRIFGDVYRIAVCHSSTNSSTTSANSGSNAHSRPINNTTDSEKRNNAFFFTNEPSPNPSTNRNYGSNLNPAPGLPLSRNNSYQDMLQGYSSSGVHDSSLQSVVDNKDHLIISWVYDVRESNT